MTMKLAYSAVLTAGALSVLSVGTRAQTSSPQGAVKLQSGDTALPGQCLTKEELELNDRLHALTRPTRGAEAGENADDTVRFNPNYLVGRWTIDGVVPESPLGPAGDFDAVDTVVHVRDCSYDSVLQVKGPGTPFTVKSRIVYYRNPGFMARIEQDSRGFQVLQMGPIGGDSGGYFSHHWDTQEFSYRGKRIRLQGTSFFASPENYRVRMQIAVDDQPFTAYGTLWWRRATTPGAAK